MLYVCEKCLHREILWNSRDGVTSFTVNCEACKDDFHGTMTHHDWQRDARMGPNYRPAPHTRIFLNVTREKFVKYKQKIIEKFWDDPEIPMKERFPNKEIALQELTHGFTEGQPDICLAREWPQEAKDFSRAQIRRIQYGQRHG